MVLHQVGEIEEQLAAARREVTKSEEANQKLQREVKEVCEANLHECTAYPNCTVNSVNIYELHCFICYKGSFTAHLICILPLGPLSKGGHGGENYNTGTQVQRYVFGLLLFSR